MPRSFSSNGGMLSGGGGGGVAQQIVEHPLAAQHRRGPRGVGRDAEDRALGQDAAALLAIELDALERSPSTPLMP